MTVSNRLALTLRLALAAGVAFGAPAPAAGLYAQSGKVIELIRAGKYADALPLAQAMVADLEKGPANSDLAGALNNLAQVYSAMGRDADAEPLLKRSASILRPSGPSSTILARFISASSAMPKPSRCSSGRLRSARRGCRRVIRISDGR
jgi:tetratricopeptide (TPR) repeat protein